MIDEKILQDRLTDTAAAQDALLPRPVADDLAAGRRRLLRHRVLAGAAATVAVGAVTVAAVGLSGTLRTAAQDEAPTAKQEQTTNAKQVQTPQAKTAPKGLDKLMKDLLARHLDPSRKHLDFSAGPFVLDPQDIGIGLMNKVGWKVAGDPGEGLLEVGLTRSEKQGTVCGSLHEGMTCQRTTLPNGRSVMIGHRGTSIELGYVQPDGEYAYVSTDPLYSNMTTTSLKSMPITEAQLVAFVTDPELNLPPVTVAQRVENLRLATFAPKRTATEMSLADRLSRALRLERATVKSGPVHVTDHIVTATGSYDVDVTITPAPKRIACSDWVSLPTCERVKLPNGGSGQYAEGPQGGAKYVMGATYSDPSGDQVAVRFVFPAKTAPKDRTAKQDVFLLVSDPLMTAS